MILRIIYLTALGFFVQLAVQAQDLKLVTDLEKQRVEAIEARAFDFVAGVYDESFRGVTGSGRTVNKTQLMEMLQSMNPHIHFAAEEVQVNLQGTLAIVSGVQLSKSKMGTVIGRLRYLAIYSKKGDQWKIIESQETIVVE